jgi:hypothetical protein
LLQQHRLERKKSHPGRILPGPSGPEQSDRIGRIFAHWVTVYFGPFFENYCSIQNFSATLFHGENHSFILTLNGLGHILGYFLANPSGHFRLYIPIDAGVFYVLKSELLNINLFLPCSFVRQ